LSFDEIFNRVKLALAKAFEKIPGLDTIRSTLENLGNMFDNVWKEITSSSIFKALFGDTKDPGVVKDKSSDLNVKKASETKAVSTMSASNIANKLYSDDKEYRRQMYLLTNNMYTALIGNNTFAKTTAENTTKMVNGRSGSSSPAQTPQPNTPNRLP
jgi:hypothetical protein